MKDVKHTIKAVFCCVAMTQLTVACGLDDGSSTLVQRHEPTVICFTCGVAQNVITRAWADQYATSLPSGSQIDVFLYDEENRDISTVQPTGSGSTQKLTGPAQWVYEVSGSADATTMRSPLSQVLPVVNNRVYAPKVPIKSSSVDQEVEHIKYFAVFPHTDGITPSTDDYPFSVNTDQTTAANVYGSDLLTCDFATVTSEAARVINLDMKHRMAKVLVVFQPDDDLTATNMPAAGSTFTVNNVKTLVTIDPQVGTVTTSGSTSNVSATVGEPFFLPPQAISGQFLTFTLRNSDGTDTGIKNVTFTPSSTLTLSANTYYVLTVTVGVTNVRLTTTIKNWEGETLTIGKILL